MAVTPSAALGQARPDLRDGLDEFDLAANQAGFIGLSLAPVIEVVTQSGKYPKLELAEILKKKKDAKRASGANYSRGGRQGTSGSFATDEYGAEEPVDSRNAEIYGDWWDSEVLAAQGARDQVLQNLEDLVIAKVDAVSNTTAAGTAWTTHATATPVANVMTAKKAVRDRIGIVPNAMAIEWDRLMDLLQCTEILDRIKYAGFDDPKAAALKNLSIMAGVFDVEHFFVAGAMKNTANESAAASLATVFTKTNALLFVHSDDRNLKRPRWCNTFHWGEDGSEIGGVVEEYDEPQTRSKIVRSRLDVDVQEVYPEAAELITGV
jgi:hypothetical protein|uniref:Major capsid protein n=1 Tax=uncultured marine virus TaxID=186617 RepID=A0A0F7L790_9VIRU|nr:hypothetical protein [uncultured marine virus]